MHGIRIRAAAIAATSVAAILLFGALLLSTVLHNHLLSNFDTTLHTQAADRANLIARGASPADLTATLLNESLIWIGTDTGLTLAAAGTLETSGAPAGTNTGFSTVKLAHVEDGESEHELESVRVVTVAAQNPDGDTVLLSVGAELEAVDEPTSNMRFLLLISTPALVALVGMLVWLTASRALRPVKAISTTASSIRGDKRGVRVPIPGTGDEIDHLATTVNHMLDRLEAHHARQQQFIGNASHELKSPVANLQVDLETVHIADPEWPETRDRLVEQTGRLTAVIEDLLVLASQDEDAQPEINTVDLDDIVQIETADAARSTGLNVDMWDVEPIRIQGDRDLLRRVMRNVLANAVRHAETTVNVGMHKVDDTIKITVGDDGDGIPEDQRESVFERFTRLDEGRAREEGGTGLGLAIVKDAMERHGGSVTIGDSDLGGALITLSLPAD